MDKLIRLYIIHDLDLVALKWHPDFDFRQAMTDALIAYVRGEDYEIPLPEPVNYAFPYKNTAIHVLLNNDEHKDVINFLSSIRKGSGNALIKLIFRKYIKGNDMSPYLPSFSLVSKQDGSSIMTIFKDEDTIPDPADIKSVKRSTKRTGSTRKRIESSHKTPEDKAAANAQTEDTYIQPEQQEEAQENFDLFSALDKILG